MLIRRLGLRPLRMCGVVNGQTVSLKHPVMDTAHYDRISHYKKLDWVVSISFLGVKTPEIPEDLKLPPPQVRI